ncbi:MAG TPA: PASTA domain-containing protein [Gaiellaceae bacterium]|nr:PASTA domain-containing protein [Gaiellaceae bacterium]
MTGRRLAGALVATALVFGGLGAGLALLIGGGSGAPEQVVTVAQPDITVQTGSVTVPDLVGLDESAAVERAHTAGLRVEVALVEGEQQRAGTVVDQEPQAATAVGGGATLTLSVVRR